MGDARSQKSLNRFLAQGLSPGALVWLDEGEAHHLIHVLRLKEGAQVILIDGCGHEYLGEVQSIKRKEAKILVLRLLREEPPPEKEITLLLPLLKKENTSMLVEKAVELGLKRVVLLITERTVVHGDKRFREKLNKRALQALKQCRRLWALEIKGPISLQNLREEAELKILAYEGEEEHSLKEVLEGFSGKSLALLSGPEGGFSGPEVEFLRSKGFISVSLGPYILRAETAAFYLMCVARYKIL